MDFRIADTFTTEINQEVWGNLNSTTSRTFEKFNSGRISVQIINHLGDEVV